MPDLLVAVGGTGQHVALAVSRLVFLGALTEMEVAVIDSDDSTELSRSLITFGDTVKDGYTGHPLSRGETIYPPFDKGAKRDPKFQDLFLNQSQSELDREVFDTCFEEQSANVSVKDGMFGRPAVGATIFEHNKYTELKRVFDRATEASTIFITGSMVGGTGAGLIHHLVKSLTSKNRRLYGLIFLRWFHAPAGGARQTISDHTLDRNMRYGLDYLFADTRALMKAALLIGLPDKPTSEAVGPMILEAGKTEEKRHYFHLAAAYGILRLPKIAVTEQTDGSIYAAAFQHESDMYTEGWGTGAEAKPLSWYYNRGAFVKELLEYASNRKFIDELHKTFGIRSVFANAGNVGQGLHDTIKEFGGSQRSMVIDETAKTWGLLARQYEFSLKWLDDIIGPLPEKFYLDQYKDIKGKDGAKAAQLQNIWKKPLPTGQTKMSPAEIANEFHKRLVDSFL